MKKYLFLPCIISSIFCTPVHSTLFPKKSHCIEDYQDKKNVVHFPIHNLSVNDMFHRFGIKRHSLFLKNFISSNTIKNYAMFLRHCGNNLKFLSKEQKKNFLKVLTNKFLYSKNHANFLLSCNVRGNMKSYGGAGVSGCIYFEKPLIQQGRNISRNALKKPFKKFYLKVSSTGGMNHNLFSCCTLFMFDNFFKGSVSIIPSLKDNRFLKMPCEKEIFAFFNQYKRNGLFLEKYFSDGMLASFVLHQLEINTNISISLTYKNFMQFLYKITEGKKDNYISFYTFYNNIRQTIKRFAEKKNSIEQIVNYSNMQIRALVFPWIILDDQKNDSENTYLKIYNNNINSELKAVIPFIFKK